MLLVTIISTYDDGSGQGNVEVVTKVSFWINVEGEAYGFIHELDRGEIKRVVKPSSRLLTSASGGTEMPLMRSGRPQGQSGLVTANLRG